MQVTGLPHGLLLCSPEEDNLHGFGTDVRVLAFLLLMMVHLVEGSGVHVSSACMLKVRVGGDLVLPDSFSTHLYLTVVLVLGRPSLENEFSQQS